MAVQEIWRNSASPYTITGSYIMRTKSGLPKTHTL